MSLESISRVHVNREMNEERKEEEHQEEKRVSFEIPEETTIKIKKTLAEEMEEQAKIGLRKLFVQLRNHLLHRAYKYGSLRTEVSVSVIGTVKERIKALKGLLKGHNISMELNGNVWIFEKI